ncbi:MAG: hypothetical protein H5U20_02300 [Rhodobacteraceae bacterium]|nr:hypothetical protein [Paracoccaceae bacterium]
MAEFTFSHTPARIAFIRLHAARYSHSISHVRKARDRFAPLRDMLRPRGRARKLRDRPPPRSARSVPGASASNSNSCKKVRAATGSRNRPVTAASRVIAFGVPALPPRREPALLS